MQLFSYDSESSLSLFLPYLTNKTYLVVLKGFNVTRIIFNSAISIIFHLYLNVRSLSQNTISNCVKVRSNLF
ncbi:hypothetical protein SAMN05192562_101321 [Kosakonia arachidis]|uniref:Uncharacterized protein n=1 Tax=Kosakonia arachidis TaxID=551989 RepID=A0A1I6Y305_9ENTR|nr:hypothetical protein SAMN05192562_101321 [Kosakonia arachidis]